MATYQANWTDQEMNDFINTNVKPEEMQDEAKEFKDIVELEHVVLDDPYLARANFWGKATAMENQIKYLGGNYLAGLEGRLNKLKNPSGILAESDLNLSMFANEDMPHINEDRTKEDQIMELEAQIQKVVDKMKRAAVSFIINVREHDDVSKIVDAFTFQAIKARAAEKRAAFAK